MVQTRSMRVPRSDIGKAGSSSAHWRWHLLDNNGSYGGHFDWVPLRLRVGPWSPFVYLFLLGIPAGLVASKPERLALPPPAATAYTPLWQCIDAAVFAWSVFLLVVISRRGFAAPMLISYTGWSWCLLGLRALCASAGTALGSDVLVRASEGMRFAALVQATVTFTVWNFALVPFLYFWRFTKAADRRGFLKWSARRPTNARAPRARTNALSSPPQRSVDRASH